MPLARDSNGRLGVRAQGGNAAPTSVRIEVENKASQPIQASSAKVQFDGSAMVIRIITDDIRRGGPIRSAISSMVTT